MHESPPFTMKSEDGAWTGIAVDLWSQMAERRSLRYVLEEYPELFDLLASVERGDIDIAIGALTNTPARERRVDFTQRRR